MKNKSIKEEKKGVIYFLRAFCLFILCFFLCINTVLSDFTTELCIADRCQTIFEVVFTAFIISLCFSLIVWLIAFRLRKHEKAKYGFIFVIYITIFVLYIHGNFLASSLNILNGMSPLTRKYPSEYVISAILVILIIFSIVFSFKINVRKAVHICSNLSFVIIIMLSVSIANTLFTNTNIFRVNNNTAVSTNKNINTYSKNKNFIIFVADAIDSKYFEEVRSKSKYKNLFNDFTYYPDTVSAYDNTTISIPFIFSGDWYENKEEFQVYSKNAYKKSDFLKYLKKLNYDMNLYETDFTMDYEESKDMLNLSYADTDINTIKLAKEELKYFGFKFSPYFLKKYSDIESFNLGYNRIGIKKSSLAKKYGLYDWDNKINYDNIVNNDIEKSNNNQFKFIHINGAHQPFDENSELKPIVNGTYKQKIEATLKVFDAYIKRLKENGVYDNSVIIFMADHGFNAYTQVGYLNPTLLIKGINEHHEFKVSDKAISYADFTSAFKDLLDDKNSTELFKNINNNRKRRYFVAAYNNFDEYYQIGKAWDLTTLKPTNKDYYLKKSD